MSRQLIVQQWDTAMEDRLGPRGASQASVEQLLTTLRRDLPRLHQNLPPEAVPMFALPVRTDDLTEIESLAESIRARCTDLVVMGMGGSSLSIEAIEALRAYHDIRLHVVDNVDPHSLARLWEDLPWESSFFLLISKSGATVETMAHALSLLAQAKRRIGPNYADQLLVITRPNGNPMHRLAQDAKIRVLAHDAALCGRFAILDHVGLLPAAVLGVDIRALRRGAQLHWHSAQHELADGMAAQAAARHVALMEKGIGIQVMMHYVDGLAGVVRWHRQCWAESLGKQGYGSTPIPCRGATDQHSQLQLYLGGPRDKLFTSLVVDVSGATEALEVKGMPESFHFLSGHSLGDLLMAEQRATQDTLVQAGCPLRTLTLLQFDAVALGALVMQFQLEILYTAYLLGINAFDQPAVEAGKRLALEYLAGRG